jgi:DNA ligase (NAD+)
MDIEGLGESTVKLLLDANLISDYGDLYYLKKEQLLPLDRMADKSAENLLAGIQASKERALERLIYALGIRLVGQGTARTLAQHFKDLDALGLAIETELLTVEDVGTGIAQSIVQFFSHSANLQVLDKLRRAGVRMRSEEKVSAGEKVFSGMTFVLTGTLTNYTREEASEIIRQSGGKTASSVSKATSVVLVGSEPGSKLQKARELGIKIMDEDEFLKLVKI